MRVPHAQHHPEPRWRDLAKLGDVPGSAGRQFQHQVTGLSGDPQHRQRMADLVVVGPVRRDRLPQPLDELGGQVLGGGLAHGTGDSRDGQAGQGAGDRPGQGGQCGRHVRGGQRGHADGPAGKHGHRALLDRGGREVVPVHPLAGQGGEQGAGGGLPRVDDDGADQGGRAGTRAESRSGDLRDRGQRQRDHAAP